MTSRHNRTLDFMWGLGEVINAVIKAGLSIGYVREHDEGFYPVLGSMARGAGGHYRLPDDLHGRIPMTYSLLAVKPRFSP
jgi:hypothetical protein